MRTMVLSLPLAAPLIAGFQCDPRQGRMEIPVIKRDPTQDLGYGVDSYRLAPKDIGTIFQTGQLLQDDLKALFGIDNDPDNDKWADSDDTRALELEETGGEWAVRPHLHGDYLEEEGKLWTPVYGFDFIHWRTQSVPWNRIRYLIESPFQWAEISFIQKSPLVEMSMRFKNIGEDPLPQFEYHFNLKQHAVDGLRKFLKLHKTATIELIQMSLLELLKVDLEEFHRRLQAELIEANSALERDFIKRGTRVDLANGQKLQMHAEHNDRAGETVGLRVKARSPEGFFQPLPAALHGLWDYIHDELLADLKTANPALYHARMQQIYNPTGLQ